MRRRGSQEATRKPGEEYGPQPFIPCSRGYQRVSRRQRVAGCRHQASHCFSR